MMICTKWKHYWVQWPSISKRIPMCSSGMFTSPTAVTTHAATLVRSSCMPHYGCQSLVHPGKQSVINSSTSVNTQLNARTADSRLSSARLQARRVACTFTSRDAITCEPSYCWQASSKWLPVLAGPITAVVWPTNGTATNWSPCLQAAQMIILTQGGNP